MAGKTSERYLINSIVRAAGILRCLAAENASLRIGDIARRLDLDRTTTYRIVGTLEHCGFLERKPNSKEYKLGVGAFEVGSAYLRSTDLHLVARPVMIDLASRVREAVHWAILSGNQSVCIDKIDSPRGLGTTSKIGRAAPLHVSSVGKVLLAFQSPEFRGGFLKTSELTRFTERTITSVVGMEHEIERIRRDGYCFTQGEGEVDMACVAAPIFDNSGAVIAGLSIGGPVHRMSEPGTAEVLIREVKQAGRLISDRMGAAAAP